MFGAFSLALAGSANAKGAEADLDRARALFDEAGELERQGQWAAAQKRLRAALLIRETPNLRYALAWALENGDRLLDARTEYEVAFRLAEHAGNTEVSTLASARITEVDRKMPLVQVRTKGTLAHDTRVIVDGREVILRGNSATVPVDPGARIVRVERVGRPATERTLMVARGALRLVEVQGDDAETVRNDGRATTQAGDRPARPVAPFVLIASGGVLVATSIALFASSAADASTRDANTRKWCDATACVGDATATRPETTDAAAFRREAYDAASRGNTKQVLGGILGGLGVASAGVGVYMLLKNEALEAPKRARRASGWHVDAAPRLGGGMASASFVF